MVAAFLLSITFIAYTPVIRTGGFIWDDDAHVTENTLLHSTQGLRSIWTKIGPLRGGPNQYYPLTYSVFWAEYHFFQLQPLGYHLVNILLHALNAILLWCILRRLRVPGALLAAAIFAVHPVHVESVAWVSELKNVLSGLFYLSTLLCYLRFQNIPGPESPEAETSGPHWRFYFPAIILFLCALTSKTVTASLPAAILLILWWKRGRIGWKDILRVSPMFFLGAGAGLLTAHIEKYQAGASGSAWALTSVEHCLLAGRILWFYLGKLIWPLNLAFIYPRWEIEQAVWQQYVFPLAAAMGMTCLWLIRGRTGRGPLAAALFFAGTLTPVLGFFNVYPMVFSYVADHFQYLASLGPIILFSTGGMLAWKRLRLRASPGWGMAAPPLAGALLLMFGILTWRQGKIYTAADQIWIDTLTKNPSCALAHNNLGVSLDRQGRLEDAIKHFREILRLDPDDYEAHANLGVSLAGQGKVDEAIRHYREALRLQPHLAKTYNNWGFALAGQGRAEEAEAYYRETLRLQPDYAEAHNNWGLALAAQGKFDAAIFHCKEALRLKPDFADAHNSWGIALARQGKTEEAITHFREALRLKPDYAIAHYNLGAALVDQGLVEEAIMHYREALRLKPDLAEAHHSWGVTLLSQGKMGEAIKHSKEALRLKPDLAEAQHNWGVALARQAKIDEAITHFREALRLKPDFAEAHSNLGFALVGQGKMEEAVAQYMEALRLKPDFASAHNGLGIALASLGRRDESIQHFREAIRLDPNYLEAQKNLKIILGPN